MAASPCIPTPSISAFMERIAQYELESDPENGQSILEKQLAALVGKLNSNALLNTPYGGSVDQSTNQTIEGGGQDFSATPIVPASTFQLSPETTNLAQAHQLLLLISNLACQDPLRKSSESSTGCWPTEATRPSTSPQKSEATASQKILHQLLSGADVSQVRNRSGLLESVNIPKTEETVTSSHAVPEPITSMISSKSVRPQNLVTSPTQICGPSSSANTLKQTSVGSFFIRNDSTPQWCSPVLPLPVTSTGDPNFQTALSIPSSLLPTFRFAEQLLAILAEIEKAGQLVHRADASADLPSTQPPPLHRIQPVNSGPPTCPVVSSFPFRLHQLLTTNIPNPRGSDCSTNDNSTSASTPGAIFPSPSRSNSNSTSIDLSTASTNHFDPSSPNRGVALHGSNVASGRPRCHSEAYCRMNYRHKLHRSGRPRSNSKVEQLMKPTTVRQSEAENLAKEFESSLFAQLVLSSDCQSPNAKQEPTDMDVDRRDSPQTVLRPSPEQSCRLGQGCTNGSISSALVCSAHVRGRIFEWLREADLFMAEHCCDIPLGALLAAAISPGHHGLAELCTTFVAPCTSEPIPSSAKRAVIKSWHQFLLVSLMENNFIPRPNSNGKPVNESSADRLSSPVQGKSAKALSLSRNEEFPAPDWFLINELTSLITTANELQLERDAYKSMRFCILAQSAYPRHFSTSYVEALADLETRFHTTPSTFVEVLKLLNRLHCFEPGTLKQFFCLASDHLSDHHPVPSSPLNQSSPSNFQVGDSTGCGASKRKACHASTTDHIGRNRDSSPIPVRLRAYTTSAYSKSARISTADRYNFGVDKGNCIKTEPPTAH